MKTMIEMTESLPYYWLQCLIHVNPMITIAVNIFFSNVRYSYFDSVFTIVISTVFMMMNCAGVRASGIVLYHFLPWDSFESIKTAALLVGMAYIINLLSCFLVNLLPYQRSLTKKLQ